MDQLNAIGRRKSAVARVHMSTGKGNIIVNGKDYKEYFPVTKLQDTVEKPLKALDLLGKMDVKANLNGGGINGQAEALSLAIARVLVKEDPEHRNALKEDNLLSRDPRQVERKKPGQPKARKRFQFSKR